MSICLCKCLPCTFDCAYLHGCSFPVRLRCYWVINGGFRHTLLQPFLLREAHSPVCLICLANIDMSVSHLVPDVQVITRRAALFTHRCDKVIKQIKPNHMTRGLKSLRSRHWKQRLFSADA